MKKLILMIVLLGSFTTSGLTTVAHAQSVNAISADAPKAPDFVLFSFVQTKDNVVVE